MELQLSEELSKYRGRGHEKRYGNNSWDSCINFNQQRRIYAQWIFWKYINDEFCSIKFDSHRDTQVGEWKGKEKGRKLNRENRVRKRETLEWRS